MAFGLETLVDDVLIQILGLLSVRDVLSMRQTSWRFESLSRLRNVWYTILCRVIIERGLCISAPLTSLSRLTSGEIEGRVKRALQLQRNWSDSKPAISNLHRLNPEKDVRQVTVLPGGHHILTLHDDELVCWDAGDPGEVPSIRCVGRWIVAPLNGCHVSIDTSEPYSGNLALGGHGSPIPGLDCVILTVDINQPNNVLTMIGEVASARGRVIALRDNLLCCECIETNGIHVGIEIFNWTCAGASSVVLARPHAGFGEYLGMHLHGDLVIVVWEHFIGIYNIPSTFNNIETEYLAPMTVFELARAIKQPISFTTCQPRIPRGFYSPNSSSFTTPEHSTLSPLTILAKPGDREAGLAHLVLKTIKDPTSTSPHHFSLVRFPVRAEGSCAALFTGPSGRGVRLEEDGGLYRCQPTPMVSPYGLVDATVDFYPNSKIDLCRILEDKWNITFDATRLLAFDDGTGRLVVGNDNGEGLIIVDFTAQKAGSLFPDHKKQVNEFFQSDVKSIFIAD